MTTPKKPTSAGDHGGLPTVSDLETLGRDYAVGWYVDDAVARGALCIAVDRLDGYLDEAIVASMGAGGVAVESELERYLPPAFQDEYDLAFLQRFHACLRDLAPHLRGPDPAPPEYLAQELLLWIAACMGHSCSTTSAPRSTAKPALERRGRRDVH